MNKELNIFDAIRSSRKGIITAMSLVVIEYAAWIIEPTLFGNVIDAFIDKSISPATTVFLLPLIAWVGVFLLNSGVGAFRRMIEPRIFMPMFTRMALVVTEMGKRRGDSVSKTTARAELVREYVTFFQYRIPELLDQAISISGAVIALAFFDIRIAIACLTIVLPLSIITKRYAKKIEEAHHQLHNIREKTYDVIATSDQEQIENYYKAMTHHEQRIARWSGKNFGIVRIFLLATFLVVLYISIDLDDFTTGNIYSIVSYLWTFVSTTEYLPELLVSITSLKELNSRLHKEDTSDQ